jgi:hypothetical protein
MPRKSITKPATSKRPQSTLEEDEDSGDEISPSKTEKVSAGLSGKRPMNLVADEAEDDAAEEDDDVEMDDEELGEDESMDELSPDFNRKEPRADKDRSETKTPAPRTGKRPKPIQEEPEDENQEDETEDDEEIAGPSTKRLAIAARAPSVHRSPQSPRSTASGPIPVRRPKIKKTATKAKGPRLKLKKGNQKRVTIQVFRINYPYKQLRDVETEEEEAQLRAAARIPGVSGGDVLAQITEEILSARIADLHEKSLDVPEDNRALRTELRRKCGDVQRFNASLSDRLLELREALDTGSALRRRLKDAAKAKARLRAEFLEIRRQREELSLRMDESRALHAESMRKIKEQNEVNIAMSDIEMAIQRGREHAAKEGREDEGPDMPIDMLLERVAVDVRSDGGGLFDRVKGLNVQMEKVAMMLEGRA